MKGGKDPWHTVFEAAEDRKGYHSSLDFLCVLFTVVYARDLQEKQIERKKITENTARSVFETNICVFSVDSAGKM